MKMRTTLAAAALCSVAVAAVAAGPMAAFAADDTQSVQDAQTAASGDTATGKLVFQTKDGKFVSIKTTTAGTFLYGDVFATKAEAEAAGENLTIPKIGKTGPVKNAAGKCALVRTTAGHNNKFWADMVTCNGSAAQNYFWDTANGVTGLRTGTLDKNSYISYQPESNGVLFFAGSNVNDFVGATGSAVVDGRLALETPAAGALIREDKPVFSGTGSSGASIEILDESGDLLVRTVVVDGKWSKRLTNALAQGVHKGTIRQILDGTEVRIAYEFTYRVVQGVSVNYPTLGGSVDVARPVFSGKGEPGGQVTILDNADDRKLIDVTVDANGDWSQQSLYTLTKGAHEGTATQVYDGATTTAPVRFAYGAPTPVTPVTVTSPGLDSVISDTKPTFTGKGQAGADVTVRGSSSAILATAKVKSDGTWSAQSTITLGNGKYVATATQVTGSSTTTAPIRYEIKTSTQVPVSVSSPAFNGSVSTSRPVFAGAGTPGASIEVKGNSGTVVASTTVGADGTWSVPARFDLAAGLYVATAHQNASGALSAAPIRYSIIATVKVSTPVANSIINTPKPVFSGTGEKGATIEVRGSSGTLLGTTTVKIDGTWSVTSTIALSDGEYVGNVFQAINGLTVKASFHYFIRK